METIEIMRGNFEFWDILSSDEKEMIAQNTEINLYRSGEILHENSEVCTGILYIIRGRLRGYVLSEDGRDISIERLRKGDLCIMSASCILEALNQNFYVEAEEETEVLMLDASALKALSEKHMEVKLFLLGISKYKYFKAFHRIQNMFFPVDRKIAMKLIDEFELLGSDEIFLTHEELAKDIGTAREVVSRNLNVFQDKGIIKIYRGRLKILDYERLRKCAMHS
ncbi:Crp/Fnr family transcriptional regulator [Eubacteriales bacterium KG127]